MSDMRCATCEISKNKYADETPYGDKHEHDNRLKDGVSWGMGNNEWTKVWKT